MAYVADDPNKLQDPNQQQQAQGTAQQTGPAQPTLSGGAGGGDVVSGGGQPSSQTAQAGSGGSGGSWTNIQNYIQANQGDTGSAQMLNDKVGSQFGQEKSNIDSQAGQLKQQGQQAADSAKVSDSNASEWLGNAAKNYSWDGSNANAYQQDVGKMQNALSAKYSGPSSFAYGLSEPTQTYGQNLENNDGFNNMLGNWYQEKTGGQLSSGGRNLQTQLDSNNQALTDSRQNLLKQYSGLGDYVNRTTQDTNSALSKAEQDFRTNQNAFKDYLTGQGNTTNDSLKKQIAAAQFNYQNELNGGSGDASANYGNLMGEIGSGGWNDANAQAQRDRRMGMGAWGSNLSYAQLQKEQDGLKSVYAGKDPGLFAGTGVQDYTKNGQDLQKFYTTEDAKYANTGDDDKRRWNAIQDILGSTADRQTQGFKVRG